jgi:aspartyl protease family protein
MWWALGVLGVALVIAIGASLGGQTSLLGLETGAIIGIAASLVLAALWLPGIIGSYRGQMGAALKSIIGWLAIVLAIVVFYAYRGEVAAVANRTLGVVVPGMAVQGSDGEVTIWRGQGGHFMVDSRINGFAARMMFDTGASTIVLTAEDARLVGLRIGENDYTVSVSTANGVTRAAPVTLQTVDIGGLVETRVEAMVARPGALRTNLLGMSYLERLSSYEVRGDRLILRGPAR